MSNYNFGEKKTEYSPKHGKDLPVWQSPKYLESKAKAEEIIASGKYNVLPSDFWILMNVTKKDTMAYTGLIISHNGCLKINDCLESKFDPNCVFFDKDGYNGSLVYSYMNREQGIYEVGEVSKANCKNEYPYAMALKRLFDRVVLKLSKLAYAGIYSDSEADEFAQRLDSVPEAEKDPGDILCSYCDAVLTTIKKKDGKPWKPEEQAAYSERRYGSVLCPSCMVKAEHEISN